MHCRYDSANHYFNTNPMTITIKINIISFLIQFFNEQQTGIDHRLADCFQFSQKTDCELFNQCQYHNNECMIRDLHYIDMDIIFVLDIDNKYQNDFNSDPNLLQFQFNSIVIRIINNLINKSSFQIYCNSINAPMINLITNNQSCNIFIRDSNNICVSYQNFISIQTYSALINLYNSRNNNDLNEPISSLNAYGLIASNYGGINIYNMFHNNLYDITSNIDIKQKEKMDQHEIYLF